jgi:hypothetical protein
VYPTGCPFNGRPRPPRPAPRLTEPEQQSYVMRQEARQQAVHDRRQREADEALERARALHQLRLQLMRDEYHAAQAIARQQVSETLQQQLHEYWMGCASRNSTNPGPWRVVLVCSQVSETGWRVSRVPVMPQVSSPTVWATQGVTVQRTPPVYAREEVFL